MFERLDAALETLRDAVSHLGKEHLSGVEAARLVDLFTAGERMCAAGRTLAARRVEETNIWQREGHRTAAEWVAAKTGTPLGQAIGVVEMGHRLADLPRTREAFCAGRLSEVQAREISGAATADPRSERALLKTAETQTVRTLREECRKVRAAAVPDEIAAYDKIHRGRYLRHWSDPDGAVRVDARLAPDTGAAVIAVIDERRDRITTRARRAGRRESSQAYAADALVELARNAGSGPSAGPRAMVHVVVDHAVLRGAHARSDQRCEIPGVGRIPAATARVLAGDAIIKGLLTKGAEIQAVRHFGRTVPSRLRTALQVRDPVCVVPGCDEREDLELDHYRIPWADGGESRLDNLARICGWHHYLKTYCGYRLFGGPGAWTWQKPDDLDGSSSVARPPPDP